MRTSFLAAALLTTGCISFNNLDSRITPAMFDACDKHCQAETGSNCKSVNVDFEIINPLPSGEVVSFTYHRAEPVFLCEQGATQNRGFF